MNNLTPLLLLFSMMNKNGFNNIKNAIEAAEGFNSKINNMANIFSFLPKLNNALNFQNTNKPLNDNYVDTLKNINDILSK